MHSDMERTVEDVCNMSQGIWEMGCADGRKIGRKEGREEGRREGREEGRKEMMRENVINLASAGLSPESISHLLKVSVKQIKEWINH